MNRRQVTVYSFGKDGGMTRRKAVLAFGLVFTQAKPKPLFKKPEDYDEFRRKFIEDVTPELEKQREARQQSVIDFLKRMNEL